MTVAILDTDVKTGTTASTLVSKTFTWSAGDLIVVLSDGRDTGGTVSGVSSSGSGLTFSLAVATTSSRTKGSIWTAVASASSSGTITITYSEAMDNCVGFFVQTDGDSIEATGSANGTTDTPTTSITTITNDAMVLGIVGVGSSVPTITKGGAYTVPSGFDNVVAGAGGVAAAATVQHLTQATAGSVTFDGSLSSAAFWVALAVAIKPSAAVVTRRIFITHT